MFRFYDQHDVLISSLSLEIRMPPHAPACSAHFKFPDLYTVIIRDMDGSESYIL